MEEVSPVGRLPFASTGETLISKRGRSILSPSCARLLLENCCFENGYLDDAPKSKVASNALKNHSLYENDCVFSHRNFAAARNVKEVYLLTALSLGICLEEGLQMSRSENSLAIEVHLADGRVERFLQESPQEAQRILDHIQPHKLFTQPLLAIAEESAMTVYRCEEIERIDLITDIPFQWSFYHDVSDITEITPEEFSRRYAPENYRFLRSGTPPIPGERFTLFIELETSSRKRLVVEVQTHVSVSDSQLTPMDRGIFIHQLLSAASLHARRREGGMILLKPAKIMRVVFYPGPTLPPPGTWLAKRAEENSAG